MVKEAFTDGLTPRRIQLHVLYMQALRASQNGLRCYRARTFGPGMVSGAPKVPERELFFLK